MASIATFNFNETMLDYIGFENFHNHALKIISLKKMWPQNFIEELKYLILYETF